MNELMVLVSEELLNLAGVVITVIAGFVGKSVMSYLNKKGVVQKIGAHKELAKIAVSFVEQVYIDLKGEAKLDRAKDKLVELANKEGLKLTDADLDAFIENAVREMKNAGKEIKIGTDEEIKISADKVIK